MPASFRLAAATLTTAGLLSALSLPVAHATNGATHLMTPTRAASTRTAEAVLADMTLRQKVGQLFMVGTPATSASSATLSGISNRHVGSVMLTGRSYGGTATPARVAARMQARTTTTATDRVRLLVATDQEGGMVQVLNGPGLSDMPSALQQGRMTPAQLRQRAGAWARQLRQAGVNMNLGPVEDTVPSAAAARSNPPIGAYDREFGYRVTVVARHGRAFVHGMSEHGVAPSIKHFPGLGRVHQNTDTSSGVTDYVTTRHDTYLTPFKASIDAGAPVVMMSTAYYHRIDPKNPAAFSSTIIRGVLRGDLGFRGVVMSDDVANARQTSRWSPGSRALKFLDAGGDLVLTVNPSTLPAMYDAVLSRAQHDAAFRAKIDAAALRVLHLKESRSLL